MCGIAGMIAPRANPEWVKDVAQNLLLATESRGKDATGIAYHHDGAPKVLKAGVPAHEFVYSDDFREFIKDLPGTWIGHCRATTQGSVKNNDNNHPLVSEATGLILVHNGHVEDRPWRGGGENPYLYQQFTAEVDTEALLRVWETLRYIPRELNLDIIPERVEVTPKEDWIPEVDWFKAAKDLVYNMGGTYAIAGLTPEEENTVYLYRSGRPLYLAYVPDEDAVVFASTKDILASGLEEYVVYHDFFVDITTPHFVGQEIREGSLLRVAATPTGFDIHQEKCVSPGSVTKGIDITVTPTKGTYQSETVKA